ncbi:MAG TPA: Gx transporter family protein [Candidatus Atopostipes pullistercoris]|uniref:Gx transporter family protein n=1 Tax=Candidatus Atopostipes pullistercoris TaxID=2838467 RepID=A0A9D2JWW3_9LACT|nr:Gx transporter family protein [Candidatus Atopostipes pullistercoris]
MSKTQKSVYIALLAAQATVISLVEGMLPNLLAFAPGAKIGLANMVTLVAIFSLSFKDSFKVVTMRLLLTSLLGGTLSTFMYSFAGSYLSFFGMLLVRKLGPERVSFIGISTTGGILFNVGQLVVASLIAQSFTVMLYLPILSFAGIIAGIVVGIVGNFMMKNIATIKKMQSEEAKTNDLSRRWYEASLSD